MPNIAQQDYIIIDWGGKDIDDAAKKAEVDAQLKNIYLANPLSLLSVVFKDYGTRGDYSYFNRIIAFYEDSGDVIYGMASTDLISERSFSIA